MIRFDRVRKRFGAKTVLDGVSFEVPKGGILFILGKSGTGKSVTLKHIVGLLKPDEGGVYVDELSIHDRDELSLAGVRRLCGMVFQHPALLDSLTIYENIAFGLRGMDENARHSRVVECLKLVHLDESIMPMKPQEISYGMQKRVSLARTLAPGPKYLLFDEPTTGLDPITTQAVNALIRDLSKALEVTSIVVSHDMQSALSVADRILVLDAGSILVHDTPDRVRAFDHPLIRDFMAEAGT